MPQPSLSSATGLAARTDAELAQVVMARAEQRDEAEVELCARFARRVQAYGRRHLRSDDAAADLAQRVLLLLIEKLRAREVREPERLASFVLGTARRTALAMRRSRGREESAGSPLERSEPMGREPDLFASAQLARCFDALADRERDTLLGTYFGEQSSDELALALGVTGANVRQIRRRAMSRLRQCLGLEDGA